MLLWFMLMMGIPLQSLGAASVEKVAQNKLVNVLSKHLPKGVKVRLENVHARFQIPSSATFAILNPHPPIGLVNFEARWAQGSYTKKVFGSVTVKASAPVAVARGPIRHGEPLTEENVTFEMREINPFVGTGYYLDCAKVYTLRANGSLRPGAVLGLGNTSVASAVQAGQAVDLVLQQGRLRIVAKVKALESGQLKNWVRVENPSSKKIMLARVTAPGEVTLR